MDSSHKDVQGLALSLAQFRDAMIQAESVGLFGAAAAAHANQVVTKSSGIDLLDYLKLTGALSPFAHPVFSPTDLAKRIGVTVFAFNKALVELGLQAKADRKGWKVTQQGERYGSYLPASRGSASGEPEMRLRWKDSVIEPVQTFLKSKEQAGA